MSPSDAGAVAGSGEPLVHDRLTVTLAGSSARKSLDTVKVALLSVLVMVHAPVPLGAPTIVSAQVPVEL